MIEVQTFNANGDVVHHDMCHNASQPLKLARLAFGRECGVAINGVDCFSFAEVERAVRRATAEVIAAASGNVHGHKEVA